MDIYIDSNILICGDKNPEIKEIIKYAQDGKIKVLISQMVHIEQTKRSLNQYFNELKNAYLLNHYVDNTDSIKKEREKYEEYKEQEKSE